MTTELGHEFIKDFHAEDGEVVQHHESLYDRLCFPIEKIPERYVGNNLSVALKLRFEHGLAAYRINARIGCVQIAEPDQWRPLPR